jgi:hypothetical protein
MLGGDLGLSGFETGESGKKSAYSHVLHRHRLIGSNTEDPVACCASVLWRRWLLFAGRFDRHAATPDQAARHFSA